MTRIIGYWWSRIHLSIRDCKVLRTRAWWSGRFWCVLPVSSFPNTLFDGLALMVFPRDQHQVVQQLLAISGVQGETVHRGINCIGQQQGVFEVNWEGWIDPLCWLYQKPWWCLQTSWRAAGLGDSPAPNEDHISRIPACSEVALLGGRGRGCRHWGCWLDQLKCWDRWTEDTRCPPREALLFICVNQYSLIKAVYKCKRAAMMFFSLTSHKTSQLLCPPLNLHLHL